MAVILIADDDMPLRATMQKLLLKAGHTVLEAANGVEAETVAAQQPVDLLITDIVMPDKEGLMLVRDLKRQQPQLKIIAMSGGGRAGAFTVLEVASQLGADTVLRKPFRGRELLEAVESLVGGSKNIFLPPQPS